MALQLPRQRLLPWIVGAAGAFGVGAVLWRFAAPWLRGPPPRAIIVREIYVYPLKGAKGISVQRAAVGKFGLKWDRLWMVVDAEKKTFITQRQDPRLVLIETRLSSSHLILAAPGVMPLAIPFEPKVQELIEVEIWGVKVTVGDEGSEVAAVLSKYFEKPVRLVRFTEERGRIPQKWNAEDALNETAFADACVPRVFLIHLYPFLLLNTASLADLNTRLPQLALPVARFRPNIVVTGQTRAYEEDEWQTVKIGSIEMENVKPCSRCKVTTVDHEMGVYDGKEPLETLRTYRKGTDGQVYFCANLSHKTYTGYISVGDRLVIAKLRKEPHPLLPIQAPATPPPTGQ